MIRGTKVTLFIRIMPDTPRTRAIVHALSVMHKENGT